MKVYACYLRVQKVKHWEIISEDVQFIIKSWEKARDWSRRDSKYSEDHRLYYTQYYREFELQ